MLEERGLRPKRSLGQNFLVDHNLIRKLVDASGVGAGDVVLEVGPGTGTMTEELLARGCRVVACELDDGLAAMLAERMPERPGGERFTLIHRDCLEGKRELAPEAVEAVSRQMGEAGTATFSLVANLPYGAATPLMTTLLMDHAACRGMAVTIQREVAERLLARPGGKEYGALAVIAQVFAEVEKVATCPPECFWPRPEVTSAMVRLRRRAEPMTRDAAGLSAWLRTLFAQRRKQIGSLVKGLDWGAIAAGGGNRDAIARVRPTMRAEELTAAEVVELGREAGVLK